MVYESDFYTTRRPYTRPISSHYTVTNPGAIIRPVPPLPQQQALNKLPHIIPYVGHKRLVSVIHTPYPLVYYTHQVPLPIRIYSRVRPSVIAAELQRIRNLPRSSNVSYVSRYLNSKDNILFDDEAREIRARADSLLRKIHVFVPRPTSSDYAEVIVPERMRSDDYIRRVLTARKNAKKEDEPEQRFGSGNLACVAYTGGKPHSRRRPYYKVADLRAADVQSDVNLLSYYAKNRQAAASAYPDLPLTERELRKARALADDRVYATPRRASPDPEPIIKPVRESKIIVEEKPDESILETLKKTKSSSKKTAKYESDFEPRIVAETNGFDDDKTKVVKTKKIKERKPDIVQETEKIIEAEPEVIFESEKIAEPEVVAEKVEEFVEQEQKADVETGEFIRPESPEVIPETEEFIEPEQEVLAEEEVIPEPEKIPELEEQEFNFNEESEAIVEETKPERRLSNEEETKPERRLSIEEEAKPERRLSIEEETSAAECDQKLESSEPDSRLTPQENFESDVEPEKETETSVFDDVEEQEAPEELKQSTDAEPDDEETDELKTVIQPETLEQEQNYEPEQNDDFEHNDDAEDVDVLQRKLDEEEMRRQVEEFKRQAEEEKRRQAEEARLADERWKAEIEERKRLEEEARQARFREIEEQERLEAARQKEEARLEAERLRDQQIAEEQRRAAEYEATIALEEEERYVIEKAAEKARQYQEIEEKLAEVALSNLEEPTRPDSTSDDCHCHDNVKSQDREERPDSPDPDDDTQIEEEAACVWTDHDDVSEHQVYDGEHEGFNSCELDRPVENTLEIVETGSEDEDD